MYAPDTLRFGHEDLVTSLVASHDSERVVTASRDGTIIVWDTSSGTILQEWPAHGDSVKALALSPDRRRLVSADRHALVVWAIDGDAQEPSELVVYKGAVDTCAWSSDGALVASGYEDGTVRIWDGDTFEQRDLQFDPDGRQSSDLQFSPDSSHLAWISGDHCCIWRLLVGQKPLQLRSHPDRSDVWTSALSFHPDSTRIATAHGTSWPLFDSSDPDACVIRIWDVATGAALAVLSGHLGRAVTSVSFSPDGGSLLYTSCSSVRVWRWDAESGGEDAGVLMEEGDILIPWPSQAYFSPDGEYIVTLTKRKVRLLRTDDYSCVAESSEIGVDIGPITFSPNGAYLAYGDNWGTVHIWQPRNIGQ